LHFLGFILFVTVDNVRIGRGERPDETIVADGGVRV